jgi:hypothetical protein
MGGRAIVSALLVAVGSVIVVAGPRPVLDTGQWLLDHSGVVLLALAAAVALWKAVPRESRKWPLLLAVVGVVILLVQHGVDPVAIAGGVLVILGALVSGLRFADSFRDDTDPVHIYRRVFYGRNITARSLQPVPQILRLLAVGTTVKIDLTAARRGEFDFLELAVTCWCARVEIVLPSHWAVAAGRLAATTAVRFIGVLDTATLITDVYDEEQTTELTAIATERAGQAQDTGLLRRVGVVIHVAGGFSKIVLRRQDLVTDQPLARR